MSHHLNLWRQTGAAAIKAKALQKSKLQNFFSSASALLKSIENENSSTAIKHFQQKQRKHHAAGENAFLLRQNLGENTKLAAAATAK